MEGVSEHSPQPGVIGARGAEEHLESHGLRRGKHVRAGTRRGEGGKAACGFRIFKKVDMEKLSSMRCVCGESHPGEETE